MENVHVALESHQNRQPEFFFISIFQRTSRKHRTNKISRVYYIIICSETYPKYGYSCLPHGAESQRVPTEQLPLVVPPVVVLKLINNKF